MPGIGNPYQAKSHFSNVKMRRAAPKANITNKKDLSDKLNNMAGVDKKKFFVNKDDHNKMGKDAFLKLLSTQLQNQDPIKPMDQKQFASDLAQFAQLEQLSNVNNKLQKGLDVNSSQDKFYGASFLGKEVITNGTSVQLKGNGRGVYLPFALDRDASKVMVRIYDKGNQLIKQIDGNALTKGSNSIRWNGKANDGYQANKGDYRFEILAWDKEYNQFKGTTKSSGLVSGVTFEGKETVLQLSDGKKVFLRDVQKFQLPNIARGVKKVPTLKNMAQKVYNNNEDKVNNY